MSRQVGKSFEAEVQMVLTQYEHRGLMRVRKVDPPVRVLGFGVKRRVIFLKNPWLDFVGAWDEREGRCVIIECKETREPRLPFGRDEGITQSQLHNLHCWSASDAAAFILWRTGGQTFFATIRQLYKARDDGRKSLTPDYCDTVQPGLGFAIMDFVVQMRAAWPA